MSACAAFDGVSAAPSSPLPSHLEVEDIALTLLLYMASLTSPMTAVQRVHMLKVTCGESIPIPQLSGTDRGSQRQNGGAAVAAEGRGAVVHDRLIVVVYSLGGRKASADLVKLPLQT